jgi:hypothetical protein
MKTSTFCLRGHQPNINNVMTPSLANPFHVRRLHTRQGMTRLLLLMSRTTIIELALNNPFGQKNEAGRGRISIPISIPSLFQVPHFNLKLHLLQPPTLHSPHSKTSIAILLGKDRIWAEGEVHALQRMLMGGAFT